MKKHDMKNYYVGKICAKHPEAGGLRTLSRRTCIVCNTESVRRSRERKKNGSSSN